MDFNFFMPVKVVSGYGCFENSQDELKPLGKRCLIVTGKNSAKTNGALKTAEKVLKDAGIDYLIYDKIIPNPLLSSCYEAGIMARKFRADFILGIGGGSPLDSAKAAAVFASNPSMQPEDIYKCNFSKALPIVLVGTTAGTGSEVTATAVLTIDSKNIKKVLLTNAVMQHLLLPTQSILKPVPII
jgi:Iron-containing alcohol dehydrogenase.